MDSVAWTVLIVDDSGLFAAALEAVLAVEDPRNASDEDRVGVEVAA